MNDFNKVVLVGNLTCDPMIKYSNEGKPICIFDLGLSNNAKEEAKRQTTYAKIIVLGKFAETCSKVLVKGRRILVEGQLRNYYRQIDDKKLKITEILSDRIIFLDSKNMPVKEGYNEENNV